MILDSEPEFSVFSFPFFKLNIMRYLTKNSRFCSQNFSQNQRVLRISIYIKPVLTFREECNVFEGLLFFRINFSLSRDLFQPACSFDAQFSLRQPLTSVTNAKNLWTFCFKGHHNESLCLSLYSYFIQVYYLLPSQKAKSRRGTLVTRAYVKESSILGDPGADSSGEGKSKWAEK